MSRNILYIRSGPYEVNFDSYNLQEVGMGRAFCAAGYNFDIVYYTKKKNRVQEIEVPQNRLRVFWLHGIRLLRSGIYPSVLRKEFLNQYDAVIVSEYSQIMSVLVARKHPNTYIYNGPYYNLFKIPPMEPIYDFLFAKYINANTKKVFCKTQMAKDYIAKKGITNSKVIGVGLDPSKLIDENTVEENTRKLLNAISGHRNMLYVGQIIPRKNIEHIIKTFSEVKEHIPDCQLILIGSGNKEYQKKCAELLPEKTQSSVIWCPYIKNTQLKYIYEKADVFVLPSIHEIFGMVLLEAMYFGMPVLSSNSAGAKTLIDNGINGYIFSNFDETVWGAKITELLNDTSLREKIGNAASKTIMESFMWEKIAEVIIGEICDDE